MGRIVRINDLDTEGLAPYRDTAELSLKAQGLFVAESPKVIRTALDAGYEAVSLLSDESTSRGRRRISLKGLVTFLYIRRERSFLKR